MRNTDCSRGSHFAFRNAGGYIAANKSDIALIQIYVGHYVWAV